MSKDSEPAAIVATVAAAVAPADDLVARGQRELERFRAGRERANATPLAALAADMEKEARGALRDMRKRAVATGTLAVGITPMALAYVGEIAKTSKIEGETRGDAVRREASKRLGVDPSKAVADAFFAELDATVPVK